MARRTIRTAAVILGWLALALPAAASQVAVVGPGQWLAVRADGEVRGTAPWDALTDDAEAALALAPSWLQPMLRIRLGQLDEELQDELAAVILDAEDPRWIDEIAFGVAGLNEADLEAGFDPRLLVDNARAIYEADPLLDYVELVEHGDATEPGSDYWTSTRYTSLDDGVEVQWELDRWDYYWYLVHPRLDYETPYYIDPASYQVADPPEGVFWRDYLLHSSTESYDYRTHYVMDEPYELGGDDLAALTALGSIAGLDVDPLVIVATADGEAVLTESDMGTGRLLVTTLTLEEAWAAGDDGLLTNLDDYGNGNVSISVNDAIACVADELPWGDDPVLANLEDLGTTCDEITAADLPALDLSAYDKIIVLGQQPRSLYESVIDRAADLESWIGSGGTLQIHAGSYDDLSDLEFPGGFSVGGDATGDLDFAGHPVLADALEGTAVLWDGESYNSLDGSRALDPDSFALDKIGWWASQNMFDNISERAAKYMNSDERAVYPQRIVHNHYGNCGECADILGAGARAALVPQVPASSAEDHTWDEVLHDGEWITFQISWSDGPTYIQTPVVAFDDDVGGSKILSGIYTMRGDGYNGNAIERYSDTVTLRFEVVDLAGEPVDGARILVATESYYDDTVLTLCQVAYTGVDGIAELAMGEGRNYWIQAVGYLGPELGWVGYPDPDPEVLQVTQVATESSTAEAGTVIDVSVELDGVLPRPAPPADDTAGEQHLTGTAELRGTAMLGEDLVVFFLGDAPPVGEYGHWIDVLDDGEAPPPNLYLVTGEQLDDLEAGGDFAALVAEDAAEWPVELDETGMPEDTWLVAYNATASLSHVVTLELATVAPPEPQGDDDDGGGCACSAAPERPVAAPALVLAASFAALWARRRRR